MTANDKSACADLGDGGAHCAAVLVYATFPSKELAMEAARRLIEARLAGCINVLPAMTSVYRWEGKVETAEEAVLLAKTVPERSDDVCRDILAHHPYQTPAVLVLPVIAGAQDYLSWIAREAEAAKPQRG